MLATAVDTNGIKPINPNVNALFGILEGSCTTNFFSSALISSLEVVQDAFIIGVKMVFFLFVKTQEFLQMEIAVLGEKGDHCFFN